MRNRVSLSSASRLIHSLPLATTMLYLVGGCGTPNGEPEPVVEQQSDLVHIITCSPGFTPSCCSTLGCFCCVANPVTTLMVPKPWFQVVKIDYTVLGNMGSVAYSNGSYTGSHTDTQRIASIGIDAQQHVGLIDAENKFMFGDIDGGGQGLQITDTTGIQISSNMVDDAAHHEKDLFSIWVNPRIRVTSQGSTITAVAIVSAGTPIVETVTAAELLGLQPIPSWKQLSSLTDAEKQLILAANPFFAPSGFNPASTRFKFLKSIDLTGPINPGDNFVAHTYDLQSDMSKDHADGWQVSDELVADYSIIPDVFKAGIDIQYQYSSIVTTTTGTVTDASLTLGTSTRGVHVGVDIYQDRSFNTLIEVPKPYDSTGAPSAWDTCGSPHSLCEQGVPLNKTCGSDSCIQTVCAEDSYCCSTYWDGICVNEATACGANSCLQTVCSEDPYCCSTYWDGTCVNEAAACTPAVCGSLN